ncbi:oligopeptide ABC transporter permease [Haloplasma contractile]|uniref:Oligopeptide ABC transporter permease protein n=1 Tax=Haloplasma contractile SSD-17B TaxID=1033810 RepID=U2FQW9_9MOLU|nr:oligopeptide ABC transporter permease [Haloplasma contractile]ERJ13404.1 Oligopeptide ABC transporter permease protein [Haloplasma contractile SSD-17B]
MDVVTRENQTDIPKEEFELTQQGENLKDVVEGETLSFWRDSWNRLMSNKAAFVALIVIGLIILGAIFIPMISPHGLDDQNTYAKFLPPRVQVLEKLGIMDGTNAKGEFEYTGDFEDAYHWWGTDNNGRDLFTRVWYGARISLFVAFVAASIDVLIGMLYGGISGYFGGKVDLIMQRIIELIAGIPNLVVATLFVMLFEEGLLPIILALVITNWIGMSRVVRAQFIKYRNQEFILASRTLGASDVRLIFKHLFPNIIGQVVVVSMFSIPGAIFYEAFLSFIGIGIQSPYTSLGALISDGQAQLTLNPHALFYPSLILSILMLGFNLLANGLRDALDPKLRSK